jgi:hypothetical protein
MFSDSFNEGRYNKPWSGGDWNQYQQGQNQRDFYNSRVNDNNRQSSQKFDPGTGNSGGNGGGDNGCGMIMLIAVGIAIAVPSAVAALICAPLMMIAFKFIKPSPDVPSFVLTYKTAFWATGIYIITACVAALLQVWLYPNSGFYHEKVSLTAVFKYFVLYNGTLLIPLQNLLVFHLLCIAISAIVMRKKMIFYFRGMAGYGRAMLMTAILILPSIIATYHLAIAFMKNNN